MALSFIIIGIWHSCINVKRSDYYVYHWISRVNSSFQSMILVDLTFTKCCATKRKVVGSIPDGVIGIFHRHNPSDRTMVLGSTQPLIKMSTRSISWG